MHFFSPVAIFHYTQNVVVQLGMWTFWGKACPLSCMTLQDGRMSCWVPLVSVGLVFLWLLVPCLHASWVSGYMKYRWTCHGRSRCTSQKCTAAGSCSLDFKVENWIVDIGVFNLAQWKLKMEVIASVWPFILYKLPVLGSSGITILTTFSRSVFITLAVLNIK